MKLHRQFSHSNAQKLISLLKDANVDDKELISIINDVSDSYGICFKYQITQTQTTCTVFFSKTFH